MHNYFALRRYIVGKDLKFTTVCMIWEKASEFFYKIFVFHSVVYSAYVSTKMEARNPTRLYQRKDKGLESSLARLRKEYEANGESKFYSDIFKDGW